MKSQPPNPAEGAAITEHLMKVVFGSAREATPVRLSVCPCGYPALNDSVTLETKYLIWRHRLQGLTWICGGCKNEQLMAAVLAWRKGSPFGYLPVALFGFEKEIIVQRPN